MRVLHVNLVCGHGGIETVIAALVREQQKIGIEADVFNFVDKGGAGQYAGLGRVAFAGRDSLTRMICENAYDVVHVVTYAASSTRLCLDKASYAGAVVATSHGVGAYEQSLDADVVTAVSGCVAHSIQEFYRQPIEVVYNGVDTSRFYPKNTDGNEQPLALWVGRGSDPHKDVGGLYALACAGLRGLRIVMVDGSAEGEESGNWLPAACETMRRLDSDEMSNLYSRVASSAGFLLSTSRTEACPMNILEGMACGCPVIAPAVGGIPELVVHKETGFLYERRDGLRGLEEAVDWLYSGDNHEIAARAGIARVKEHFSVEQMCRRYTDVYTQAARLHTSSLKTRVKARIMSSTVRTARLLCRPRFPHGGDI